MKKLGRKCTWDDVTINDLVDIILENETFKKKLLLTNVKKVKTSEYHG